MSGDAGRGVEGRRGEANVDEDDPFDDIWVPSLYIILKVYEQDSPLLMWQKAEYHRKENNMKQRPYALCMACEAVENKPKEDILEKKRKNDVQSKGENDENDGGAKNKRRIWNDRNMDGKTNL